MSDYVLAVPCFSEGRRTELIESIISTVRGVAGVNLIGFHPDADFNRTVVTLIGKPDVLRTALLDLAGAAIRLIDMRHQQGAHPRIGSLDVVSLFPLRGITLEECVALADGIGAEIYERFDVPVYFSGENARRPERRHPDVIRRGQFEKLSAAAHLPERSPDLGPAALHPRAGATIVSAAAEPPVAFNVILGTSDLVVAQRIAKAAGGPTGGFAGVRAIALRLRARQQVCVSLDLYDYVRSPLYRVLWLIEMEAARSGVSVVGTEIVGVVPQAALNGSLEGALKLERFDPGVILEHHLRELAEESAAASDETPFLDRLASSDPIPGGAAAAAHTGALAAALVAMTARVSLDKPRLAASHARLAEILAAAEEARTWFREAATRDEDAYQMLLEARRMPREGAAAQAARFEAIESATRGAAEVPLSIAECAARIMALSVEAMEIGNVNAITDAAAAAWLARATLAATSLSVRANAVGVCDRHIAGQWLDRLDLLEEGAQRGMARLDQALSDRATA